MNRVWDIGFVFHQMVLFLLKQNNYVLRPIYGRCCLFSKKIEKKQKTKRTKQGEHNVS